MAKTHKFSLKTSGLSDDQAAQLHYLISCAAHALVEGEEDRYDSISTVPLKALRALSPDGGWTAASSKDLVDLVK